ncbi:Uric acid degradation bifunctional protein PucL [Hartmannibacter diazotrophicus]|uniref:2-oxo-4-hydroxy-4-carboxy-5-ureidoimidazoline decarboxylase n=1 Tax=Hartmannibacter diazotrophicus TaxID=1482074 RepID=A0A2C9D877_9HYPH|nr:2-oxo-4-hydroxy-4-carboxy-5-ureidoimidazoline decarboxylase [Hartmannibacter diazotrophicus]SON56476.1 Uric acid degradation bifunctional protein PucL [Hartmannibacter diazotrophicus]
MSSDPLSIEGVNGLPEGRFMAMFGDVAEHSPWVARQAMAGRPFADREAMIQAMTDAIGKAPLEARLALIRAHPDLAGKAAIAGEIAEDSRREQAGVGLDRLTESEYETFQRLNDSYKKRFGFPFILAVKGATKEIILREFQVRVQNDPVAERETALAQIGRIIRFRIEDRVLP